MRQPRRSVAGALLVALAAACGAVPAGITGRRETSRPAPGSGARAAPGAGSGYWMVASDGGIFSFGDAAFHGSTGGMRLNRPVTCMASTPAGSGYWLVASDGGVFTFGDAEFHGSTGGLRLAQPVVGLAATPAGSGYWMVASDGGVFTFGDAEFHGSTGGLRLASPIVGIAPTPTGRGYWLVASDGGVFTFGDAEFHGSTGGLRLAQPIVGLATTPTGRGYWLVASDGGVFTFGDAEFHGSTGGLRLVSPIVGMAATGRGAGYWLAAADGGIFAFGDAAFHGSTGGLRLASPVVGIAGLGRPGSCRLAAAVLPPPPPPVGAAGLERVAVVSKTGTTNSDLAFWGNLLYAGNYDGFLIVDVSDPAAPRPLADVRCPGAQGDVSVWDGRLLFVSVDRPLDRPGCDGGPTPSNSPGWEGIRLFDVSDPSRPRLVAAVATDCGSHTHTLVPDPGAGRVLLYVSSGSDSPSTFGPTSFGNSCQLRHQKISVVEVPLSAPERAAVVSQPSVPLAPYFRSGGEGCHDIGVLLPLRRAAGACYGQGVLFDLADLANPRATAVIDDPRVEAYHSAAFSQDGSIVVFGDEALGGAGAGCTDPSDLRGRVWFHSWAGGGLLGTYKIPRAQSGVENCTVHNYNVVPIAGGNLLSSGWFQGGTSLVDFTDPAAPREVAHADPEPLSTRLVQGGAWSSYFYNGYVYVTDMTRGIEVYRVTAPEATGARPLGHLNPQTQE